MIMSYITVDMNRKGITPHIIAKQLDSGRGVEITVTCDGNLVDETFEETRISIDSIKTPYYCSSLTDEPVISNLTNGKTIWKIDSDVLNEPGTLLCEIRLVKNGDVVSSMLFEIWVEATASKENATIPKNAVDFITRAEDAASSAENSAKEAKEFKESANEQMEDFLSDLTSYLSVEDETEWVFDGGDAGGMVDVEFSVDNDMSDFSTNPVQNKVVKKYVDTEIDTLKEEIGISKNYVVEEGTAGGSFFGLWTYRKWNNGKIDCSVTNYGVTGSWQQFGAENIYYTNVEIDYPSFLIGVSCSSFSPLDGDFWPGRCYAVDNDKKIYARVWCPREVGAGLYYLNLKIEGRWK